MNEGVRKNSGGVVKWLLILIAVAGLAAGGYFYSMKNGDDSQQKVTLGDAATEVEPLAGAIKREDFDTTSPIKVDVPVTVLVSGSLIADEQSDVAARRSGVVEKILVDRGDLVEAGADLVLLDSKNAVLALDQAKAQAAELMVRLGLERSDAPFTPENQPDVKSAKARLDLAKSAFDRDEKLFAEKVIPPSEFDESRNRLATAQQTYELGLAQASQLFQSYQTALQRIKQTVQAVDDTRIRAPYRGYIVEKSAAPGEYLQEGGTALQLVRVDPLRLELSVPEQDVTRVSIGQKVDFQIAAYPGRTFSAEVKRIIPSVSAENRSLIVEALVGNPDGVLKPGFFVQAQVIRDEVKTVSRLPKDAVRVANDIARVYILEDQVVRERVVNLSEIAENHADVTSGVNENDRVITDASLVQDGMKVVDELTSSVAMLEGK